MFLYAVCGLLILLIATGLIYQAVGERRDRRRFPPPGRIRNGLHLHAQGEAQAQGEPTVVLEAGIAATSVSWRYVADLLAKDSRVVSYDRSGFGWSAARPAPRTIAHLVSDLQEVIEAESPMQPVILVAHSFGGLLVRHYAALYPERVAALVLVDPLMPFEWCPLSQRSLWRLRLGSHLSRRGAWLAQLGVVRFTLNLLLSGSHAIPKLMARATSGPGAGVTDRIVNEVRKLPSELWPVMAAHWSNPRGFRTMAEYLSRLPESCALAIDSTRAQVIPMTVISAASSPERVVDAHRGLAESVALGRHVYAENSGHWILLDRPELVAAEVRRYLSAAQIQ